MSPEEKDKLIFAKIDKLETHLINLNYTLQSINSFFCDKNSRDDIAMLMKQILSAPLQINERPFQEMKREAERLTEKMDRLNDFLREHSFEQTSGEIMFIGKKINEINRNIELIQKDGIKRNVDLHFSCDGYTLVKEDVSQKEIQPNTSFSWDKVLDCLPAINKKIIIKRLGLLDNKEMSFKDIGRQLGISNQTASHHFQKGLRMLRTIENKKKVSKCDSVALKQAVGVE